MSGALENASALRSLDAICAAVANLLARVANGNADSKAIAYLEGMLAGAQDLRELYTSELPDAAAGPAGLSSAARHTMRNLLNRISGPCQLLQRRLADSQYAGVMNDLRGLVEQFVATVDGEATASGAVIQAAQPAAAERHERAWILVAEDDAQNRQFLFDFLTAEGHTVALATDGIDALAQSENQDFDLILLDLGLPRLSGFDVLERLQSGGSQTPVIVVTGRRGVEDAVRCIEHGADDFLTKPIQIELLRARVKSCVEKMRLREREFGQFFPPKLARMFARRPNLIRDLPSKHAEVSVLFCDIREFTAISERLGPDKTMRWLRAVMHELSELVIANEGVLVDFAGDEIMAMWGAPEEIPDHAARACDTAVQILQRLPSMSEAWQEVIRGDTDLAVGINSGRAMVGHIGTARKTKYGPLGDTVNCGSRVLGATKYLQTNLLITGATKRALDQQWRGGDLRRLCRVRLKNIEKPVELYEVQPRSDVADAAPLRARYETALAHFENEAFQQASAVLGQLLVDYPDDGPSLMLMSRVVGAMLAHDDCFDPVWTLKGK